MSTTAARKTRQKSAIRSAFENNDRPLSPHQVLEIAQDHVDGMGIATVYRNIRSLVAEKWLVAVELPGAPPMYERAGKAHHHHFHCESCSRVFELHGCVPDLNKLAGRGFRVSRHELILYGTCAECRRA